MRKKIKELMNREEGFTLVELLAVIAILGLIVAIAVPAIGDVISDSRTKSNAAEETLIVDAARLYFIEADSIAAVGSTPIGSVDVSTLAADGYLDNRSGDEFTDDTREVVRDADGNLTLQEQTT